MPAPEAIAHSERLTALIANEIRTAGGTISFARYMEMALYTPGLGYYSGGATKLGGAGDFVTAPELTPLFGMTLAGEIAPVLAATDGDILELGAGTGKLARDLLLGLDVLQALPRRYLILDLSAELVQRQQALLRELPAHIASRIEWIQEPPTVLKGVIVGNEVLDALPVHLVTWRGGDVHERRVQVGAAGFSLLETPVSYAALRSRAQSLTVPVPYQSEIGLAATALVEALAQTLAQGVMLLVDYGFGAAEFYHPQRDQGTLMCHYRHRAHGDPFFHPGLQDITAHVDFSAVLRAGEAAGLALAGYTTQASFLLNAGILDLLARIPAGSLEYTRAVAPVQMLLSPAEMGELFKVIAFSRGYAEPLSGFRRGDLGHLL